MTPTERDRKRAEMIALAQVRYAGADRDSLRDAIALTLLDVRREAMDAAYEEIAAMIEHDEGALGGAMGDQPLRDCNLPEAIRAQIGGGA